MRQAFHLFRLSSCPLSIASWLFPLGIDGAADDFMLRGRLSFGNGTPAQFPSALILWGALPAQIDTMRREFPTAWRVGVILGESMTLF